MKLLVLGASGATGSWVTRMSAQAGHDVTALVRPSATFVPPTNVRVMRGEVLDAATLAAAIDGQDAVACCLGIRRAGKAPWSALLSPPDLMSRVAGLLVSTMPRAGVRRADVAAWMLGALSRPTVFVEQTVLLGTFMGDEGWGIRVGAETLSLIPLPTSRIPLSRRAACSGSLR